MSLFLLAFFRPHQLFQCPDDTGDQSYDHQNQ
ncbi:Uncharacterised protein [Vibrio cholerae]|nr:Uncharacterised protein [Vibrio cholerae]